MDNDEKESLDIARGKLLSLTDLENYEILPDILLAGDIQKQKDGNFKFEHGGCRGRTPNFDLDQNVYLDSESLWDIDLTPSSFKKDERNAAVKAEKNGKLQRFGV